MLFRSIALAITLLMVCGCVRAPRILEGQERRRRVPATLAEAPPETTSPDVREVPTLTSDAAHDESAPTEPPSTIPAPRPTPAGGGQVSIASAPTVAKSSTPAPVQPPSAEPVVAPPPARKQPAPRPPSPPPIEPAPATAPDAGVLELETVHFAHSRDTFTMAEMAILDANAAKLKARPEYHVVVEGHTDASGAPAYNYQMGIRRARAVALYLIERGVAGERIEVVSYGEDRPLDRSRGAKANNANRRVQFLAYLPDGAPSPSEETP